MLSVPIHLLPIYNAQSPPPLKIEIHRAVLYRWPGKCTNLVGNGNVKFISLVNLPAIGVGAFPSLHELPDASPRLCPLSSRTLSIFSPLSSA